MKIISKRTNKEKVFTTRQQILLNLMSPMKEDFSLESNTLAEVIEKYKDRPLVKYEPTEKKKKKMEEDPEYILDLPRFIIEGYDDVVSNSRFDQKLCDEFYSRFMDHDKVLFDLINRKNPKYKIAF